MRALFSKFDLDTRETTPAQSAAMPMRAIGKIGVEQFELIRRRMVLEFCKWDPQVGDFSTICPFAVVMGEDRWAELRDQAEQLAAETVAAEEELLHRPELFRKLAIPRALRHALGCGTPPTPAAARVMRFDFHWTRDGWRISEVNSDVPGGFTEGSALPELLAPFVPGAHPAGNPARILAERIGCDDVGLLAAAGYIEDFQVVSYLGRYFKRAVIAQPSQVRWRDGRAVVRGKPVDAIVRFFQAEWLARQKRENWWPIVAGGKTSVVNPATAILTESKRLPLVFDELAAKAPTWRRLLPETRDVREVNWREDGWLLKTAFCNTGDTVSCREWMSKRHWAKVGWDVRLWPGNWVAQKRFETVALQTPLGPMYPCVGVYAIDGKCAGAYLRLSAGPVVDYRAMDAALLIETEEAR